MTFSQPCSRVVYLIQAQSYCPVWFFQQSLTFWLVPVTVAVVALIAALIAARKFYRGSVLTPLADRA